MATPMTAAQLVAQLKKWRVPFKEVRSWKTHNRAGHGAWGPVNGFIWHHTGADVTDAAGYAAGLLYDGRSDLPGPLCHIGVGKDGTAYLVGWGRANHAGGGDPTVLNHVINEDYTGQLHPTRGNSNGTDGNARFYGMEIMYSGSHDMSAAQYATALKVSAALLDFHAWTSKSVIGHGEWSNDKWDPGHAPSKIMNMAAVREDVAATLDAGTGAGGKENDDMPQYVSLGLAKPYTLNPGAWDSIEYTKEWTDELNAHATNGSVWARGPARFTGSLSLRITDLKPGQTVQARMSEYDGDTFVQDHPIHEVIGTGGDAFATMPLVKRLGAGRGMRVRLLNNQDQPVTVTSAVLVALVWKEG